MSSGNTCQRIVGRLIEIRLDEGYRSPADVDEMNALMKSVVDPLPPHERIIIAADWRRCTVMGAATADRARTVSAVSNPRILRSAILIMPDAPRAMIQAVRFVDESKLGARRIFTSPEEQMGWLGEVTTPKEQARLMTFLVRTALDRSPARRRHATRSSG